MIYPVRSSGRGALIKFGPFGKHYVNLSKLSRSFFQDITHPSSSLYHLFPLHMIRMSCLGSERPHGLHVLSHAPKNIAPLLITP